MPTYDDAILRTGTLGTNTDPLVPEPLLADVIALATQSSVALSQCANVRMASGTARQPVLATKAIAYWRTGDTGLIQTTKLEWENVDLVAESLDVIVPIPKTYLSDSIVDVWGQVRGELAEAVARQIDAAVLFGTGAPSTFGDSLYEVADGVGNVVQAGTNDDLAADIAEMGELLEGQGYNLSGFASKPGFGWSLRKQRTADGIGVIGGDYQVSGSVKSLYGLPLNIVANGAWDTTSAVLIGGDFTKAVIGIREDAQWETSNQAVIQDGQGAIVYNLWQQDMVALKLSLRYGFATANPVTAVESSALERAPFAVLTPGT